MENLDGLTCIEKKNYCLFHIEEFTNQLQEILKKDLAIICHGESKVELGSKIYSYNTTVKEFLKRYEEKPGNIKKGMIGELLVHVLIRHKFNEYEIATPFFNMEERSVKKGYDVILTEKGIAKIWIVEIKSGEIHKDKNANQTMSVLLNTAKADLETRLNEENSSLWLEAINGAQLAYSENKDLKKAVIGLLTKYAEDAVDEHYESKDKNVFLAGVLFEKLTDKVVEQTIKDKQDTVKKNNIFSDVYVLSLQKGTYEKVYSFLKDEVNEKK